MSTLPERSALLAAQIGSGIVPAVVSQGPHIPAPLSTPIAVTAKAMQTWPIKVPLTPKNRQALLDYNHGKRGGPTMAGVKAFVVACAKAASGARPVGVNVHVANLVLTPDLQIALRRLNDSGHEFSSEAYGLIFERSLNRLIHP